MVRSDHGLPKVSPGPTMPYPSIPCGQAIPETALWLFQGWPTRRASVFYPLGHPTPYAYVCKEKLHQDTSFMNKVHKYLTDSNII